MQTRVSQEVRGLSVGAPGGRSQESRLRTGGKPTPLESALSVWVRMSWTGSWSDPAGGTNGRKEDSAGGSPSGLEKSAGGGSVWHGKAKGEGRELRLERLRERRILGRGQGKGRRRLGGQQCEAQVREKRESSIAKPRAGASRYWDKADDPTRAVLVASCGRPLTPAKPNDTKRHPLQFLHEGDA